MELLQTISQWCPRREIVLDPETHPESSAATVTPDLRKLMHCHVIHRSGNLHAAVPEPGQQLETASMNKQASLQSLLLLLL